MSKFAKIAALMLILFCATEAISSACTSVIISGKLTPDGRPLMWKNRDTGSDQNMMKYFPAEEGKFSFVAVVDSHSDKHSTVWIGTNSEGFSIMNTMSYNVKRDTLETGGKGSNGSFMKKALAVCRTVDDFEEFLKAQPQPWGVTTNFGVLDAKGGAAYFEVNYHEYFKYDVNDPEVAPEGYIVRSNYSLNGRPIEEGRGHARYIAADEMVKKAIAEGTVTPDFILKNMARNYCNPLIGLNLKSDTINKVKSGPWAFDTDFITRKTTTSSVVIQGVRPDENPQLVTLWSIISYPGTTVAVPVWECGGQEGLPRMLKANFSKVAPLGEMGYKMKESIYCWDYDNTEDNAKRYFRWDMLWNNQGTGYLQKVLKLEKEVLPPYQKALEKWQKKGQIDLKELKKLNDKADEKIDKFYKTEFGF